VHGRTARLGVTHRSRSRSRRGARRRRARSAGVLTSSVVEQQAYEGQDFSRPCTPSSSSRRAKRSTKVKEPRIVKINRPLAELLGLDPDVLASPQGAQLLSGNILPAGAASIALAYAGHQFGHFVPQLGDGRAILLGEVIGKDGKRRDVQLKGAGRTPFSRGGDGRAALGPVLREYVVSEAMAALGVPTTRALAAVLTGEYVARDES